MEKVTGWALNKVIVLEILQFDILFCVLRIKKFLPTPSVPKCISFFMYAQGLRMHLIFA